MTYLFNYSHIKQLCITFIISLSLFLAFASVVQASNPGDLDPSFGADGKTITAISNFHPQAIALQSDGKIVVAGYSDTNSPDWNFAVARFEANGTLDTSFGTNGLVTTDFGLNLIDRIQAIAIQNNGQIVVAGYSWGATTRHDFALIRYNSDGTIDTTFGTGGKVTTDFDNQDDRANSLIIQTDGTFLVGGTAIISGTNDFALVRYLSNGTLDTTFGTNGKTTLSFGSEDYGIDLIQQVNGQIILAGRTGVTNWNFALAGFTINGVLDTTFGVNGKVTSDIGSLDSPTSAIKIFPSGWMVAGINSFIQSAILRYNSDGTPDTSFGTNGQVTTSDTHIGGTVMLQTDGKIVATTGVGFRLSRYLSNGQLDTTFGTNGRVSSFFGGTSWANTAIKQTDGKVVIADTVNNNLTVARYIIEPATVYLPFIFVAASSDLE